MGHKHSKTHDATVHGMHLNTDILLYMLQLMSDPKLAANAMCLNRQLHKELKTCVPLWKTLCESFLFLPNLQYALCPSLRNGDFMKIIYIFELYCIYRQEDISKLGYNDHRDLFLTTVRYPLGNSHCHLPMPFNTPFTLSLPLTSPHNTTARALVKVRLAKERVKTEDLVYMHLLRTYYKTCGIDVRLQLDSAWTYEGYARDHESCTLIRSICKIHHPQHIGTRIISIISYHCCYGWR